MAENVVPAFGLKRPLEKPAISGGTNSVSSMTLNSIYAHIYPKDPGLSTYVGDEVTEFHGSKTDIYVYDRALDTWTSVASGLAATGEPPAGRFASYGNDVWYTNRIDEPQVRTNNTGSFASGVSGSTFKPKPRFLCVVKSYMMGFDLNNASHFSDSYAWSVPGNPAIWDASASGGGGTGRIVSRPGQIMGAVGGEYARVFKRNSMHVLQFTGDVVGTSGGTWREDVISESVGTPWPGSIVLGDQGALYFLGQDSYFYRQQGVSPPERISPFEISAWLADTTFSPGAIEQTPPATMTEEDLWVMGAYNPITGIIFWAYKSSRDAGPTNKTRGVFFSTITQEFTTWSDTTSWNIEDKGIQTLGGLPPPGNATETLAGVVMTSQEVTTSSRYTFSDGTITSCRLVTRKQALAMSQQELPIPAPVRITRIIPVMSTKLVSSDPYIVGYEDIPPEFTVVVVTSNDPNFKIVIVDAEQINPRYESATALDNADVDSDELPYVMSQGTWQVFDVRFASSNLVLRAMPGLWINWEPAGGMQ